jgi:uncharacterized membrane protein YkoI
MSRLTALALLAIASTAGAQATKRPTAASRTGTTSAYTKDLPDSLLRIAKVTEASAATTALARVANGTIAGVELEREGGKLLYSYDIKVRGKSGIDEVQVDAMTGATIGGVAHENAAVEKKEAAAEAKEKAAARKATTGKKPPR